MLSVSRWICKRCANTQLLADGEKIPLAEVPVEILSSMGLNFPCLDRDNLVSFVFLSIEIDYLWHRRIGFVCQWLVLQDPEGCAVGRSALQVDRTWFNFGRVSTIETIGLSSRSVETKGDIDIGEVVGWGLLEYLLFVSQACGAFPSRHLTSSLLPLVAKKYRFHTRDCVIKRPSFDIQGSKFIRFNP
jgi:hypothetical protein